MSDTTEHPSAQVIARFPNLSGALVIVTETYAGSSVENAECDGCHESQHSTTARAWANTHSAACRALPTAAEDEQAEKVIPVVDIVVLHGRGADMHVLLIRRGWDPFAGSWALPGGMFNIGETPREAAFRELEEETGFRIGQLAAVDVYADPGRDPRGRVVSWAFAVRFTSLLDPHAGDDAAEAHWFPVDEALRMPLAFDHDRIIRDALLCPNLN